MNYSQRSLILITIDCLRADHVGFLGYGRPTTPFLDSIAGESLVFRNAFAAGTPTYYSVPAILASRYSLALGRDVLGIAPEESTLASVLKEYGFSTAALCGGNPYLSAKFGYASGFEFFEDFLTPDHFEFTLRETSGDDGLHSRANQMLRDLCHTLEPLGRAYDELYFQYCQNLNTRRERSLDSLRKFPSADVVVDHAISWIKENSHSPVFLWLHLMDPHAPYFPKQEALDAMGDGNITAEDAQYLNSYWARGDLDAKRLHKKRDQVIALYDAGIRWADAQIQRLVEMLVDQNRWSSCTLAVTADHGEEFLDHGGRFHPPVKLTEELTRVPLLVRIPTLIEGMNAQRPVSLMDLSPSLLDALELPAPADFRGKSFLGRPTLDRSSETPVITECVRNCTNPFRREHRLGSRLLAVRNGNRKLVIDFEAGTEQLFDLERDPLERDPLAPGAATVTYKALLGHARKHVVESHKARDFDRRMSTQLRELRLEWAHSRTNIPN